MPVDLAAAITMNNSKFKTMICKNFETLGACALGEKCHFAHGVKELRTTNGVGILYTICIMYIMCYLALSDIYA